METILGPSTVAGLHLVWSVPTSGPVYASPAVVDGVVYDGSGIDLGQRDTRSVYALDAASGAAVWTSAIKRPPTSPAIVDGLVVVNDHDANLVALNQTTGKRAWIVGTGETSGGLWLPAVAVADGTAFAEAPTRTLTAVDLSTQTVVWTAQLHRRSKAAPAVSGGVVYTIDQNGFVYAFAEGDGHPLWVRQIGGNGDGGVAVSGSTLLVHTNGRLIALGTAHGGTKWQVPLTSSRSTPAVANGIVYASGGDGTVQALDVTSGAVEWTATLPGGNDDSPAVANGVVYVGGGEGSLFALAATTGSVLWHGSVGGRMVSSPAVVDGHVYIGSTNGNILAFGL
jgi:outer membrane protein assembly factor BamB